MSFPVQVGLFGELPGCATGTTALYPNRVSDKAKVERILGLSEHPGETPVAFFTRRGTLVASGYVRVVYGDHGPYVEFRRDQIQCELVPRFCGRPLPADAYYEWLQPNDGSELKVYDQKRDVRHIRNAPAGGFAGNRAEGYADYLPGMIYISPWEMDVRIANPAATATRGVKSPSPGL